MEEKGKGKGKKIDALAFPINVACSW